MNAWVLALIVASCVQDAGITVAVPVPESLRERAVETAVACRDSRGGWLGADTWRPLDPRVPRVQARPGCRVLVRAAGAPVYLASDAVAVRDRDEPIRLSPRHLRTVYARPSTSHPFWVSASSSVVECFRTPDSSRCLFVPAGESGALVAVEESGLRFALSRAGDGRAPAHWEAARWARLVSVRAPRGGRVTARLVRLEPALRHGRGLLREARPATSGQVHRLGESVFWISVAADDVGTARPPGDLLLEIAAARAATARVSQSDIRGSPLTVLDVPLASEEIIEGDVRSGGILLAGASVTLLRLLDVQADPEADDEHRPMERIAETTTDDAGRFRFGRLSRDDYELSVSHARRGRARVVTGAPAVRRVTLTPHATARGRVIRAGVPVSGATVTVLPSYDAVMSARDPMALFSEAVQTMPDGRFELLLPDDGRVAVTVVHEGAAARVELGDVGALPPVVDIGDIPLAAPFEAAIRLDVPSTCAVAAAGPVGQPGMFLLRADPVSPGRWMLRSVLEGRWFVEVSCEGVDIPLEVAVIQIDRTSRELIRLSVRRERVP